MSRLLIVWMAASLGASSAVAQTLDAGNPGSPDAPPATADSQPRSDTAPSREGRLAAGAEWLQGVMKGGNGAHGFYPELGGLPPGSGVSIGPGYRYRLLGGRAVVDGSAAVSWSRGTFAQATFELPTLASNKVSVGTQLKRQDFTRLSFYGVGSSSEAANGTEYGLENSDYRVFASVRPWRRITAGGSMGYLRPVAVEGPRSATLPAIQQLFTVDSAPGLVDRPSFLHGDVYADVDTRNHRARPTSGGDYRATFTTFSDRTFDHYTFQRVEGEASQFIPFLHENWVIALRARAAASFTADGDFVPIYLLPALGGGHSLRGYDDYRFMDRDAFLANAEYRWRVFGALDGALFYDAGNVAPRFGDLDFTHLKTAYGLGFRLHSDTATFLRFDVARGSEGTQFVVSINESLRPGHGSILIPYVP
jgi:outer membrane protein assembly factor BamA